jgi:hypothetical protein
MFFWFCINPNKKLASNYATIKKMVRLVVLLGIVLFNGCASAPPSNPNDICEVFRENPDWHEAAKDTYEKWGVPVHIPMAILYQESAFRPDAAPPMEYFLWIIPIGRISSAYGYSQAKTVAWQEYIDETGNWGADRDSFDDAIDFVGWYITKTNRINRISKWSAYHQYLNYHEGRSGYRHQTYKNKPWLQKIARSVESRSKAYARQYSKCKNDLPSGWFDW